MHFQSKTSQEILMNDGGNSLISHDLMSAEEINDYIMPLWGGRAALEHIHLLNEIARTNLDVVLQQQKKYYTAS